MSAVAKLYLWKGRTAVKDPSGLQIKIVDTDTGEFIIEGADIGIFYQHMLCFTNNENPQTETENTNDQSEQAS